MRQLLDDGLGGRSCSAGCCGILVAVDEADSDEWRALRECRKPTGEEWAAAKSRFTSGVVATGVVLSHHAFGFSSIWAIRSSGSSSFRVSWILASQWTLRTTQPLASRSPLSCWAQLIYRVRFI